MYKTFINRRIPHKKSQLFVKELTKTWRSRIGVPLLQSLGTKITRPTEQRDGGREKLNFVSKQHDFDQFHVYHKKYFNSYLHLQFYIL